MTPISEASFMAQVKSLAYLHGWSFHHQAPMRTPRGNIMTGGSVGFPDLVLCHPVKGLVFAELKTTKGKTSVAQDHWLAILNRHAEVYVWRPEQLQEIEHRLSGC